MLDFKKDANGSIYSENAAKYLLEKYFGIDIKVVADLHLKYDLIVTRGNDLIPTNTKIDVKENFNTNYNNFILEAINNGWNAKLGENSSGEKSYISSNDTIYSWGWSFAENMTETDYIFFLDKDWNKKEKTGNRKAFLIKREEILKNNKEQAIKSCSYPVIWNYISKNNGNKWRSAFISVPLEHFEIPYNFTF